MALIPNISESLFEALGLRVLSLGWQLLINPFRKLGRISSSVWISSARDVGGIISGACVLRAHVRENVRHVQQVLGLGRFRFLGIESQIYHVASTGVLR